MIIATMIIEVPDDLFIIVIAGNKADNLAFLVDLSIGVELPRM